MIEHTVRPRAAIAWTSAMTAGVLALVLLTVAAPARAQECGVPRDLGTLPGGTFSRAYGISADGSAVVGWADGDDLRGRAFRWTATGGMLSLGVLPGTEESSAAGISADGSTVFGHSGTPGGGGSYRACRWTMAAGAGGWEVQSLGTLPGSSSSYATASSADGSVVVGFAVIPLGGTLTQTRAFRWSTAGGMEDLGTLAGFDSSRAESVSGDGAVVVGTAEAGVGVFTVVRAFRWTAAGGMEDLSAGYSSARGVSADGATVVGVSADRACRWTTETGLQTIGPSSSFAAAVSSDGSVVVGGTPSSFGVVPFRWTTAHGMRLILDRPPNGSTWEARGVSANGEWVVGSGYLNSGERAILWRRPICRADLDCSGSVSVQDVFDFLTAYFVEDVAGDFNQDTVVFVQDIFDFLAAYFAGC